MSTTNKHTLADLQDLQALPLNSKIALTRQRIREWIREYGEEGVYVSFSGGKDSTVLLDIVRKDHPNVPAVFVDVPTQYPELREFAQSFDNVVILRPQMSFMQVCEKYGFPLISKEVAECVYGARKYLTKFIESEAQSPDRQTDRQTDRQDSVCVSLQKVNGDGRVFCQYADVNRGGETDPVPLGIPETDGNREVCGGRSGTDNISEQIWRCARRCRIGGGNGPARDLPILRESEPTQEESILTFGKTLADLQPRLLTARAAMLLGVYEVDWGKRKTETIPSKGKKSMFSEERYQFFLEAPFEISNQCCRVMKKDPLNKYAKETGRVPITAQMASESKLRTQVWLKYSCNMFDAKHPKSNPMSFWTEQDVLLYIYQNKLPICSVYGEVVKENEVEGQLDFADLEIFDLGLPTFKTTGCKRTGCMLCGFGAHHDTRFLQLKETHPQMYGLLDIVKNSGVTMREAIEWTCEHGNLKIPL